MSILHGNHHENVDLIRVKKNDGDVATFPAQSPLFLVFASAATRTEIDGNEIGEQELRHGKKVCWVH